MRKLYFFVLMGFTYFHLLNGQNLSSAELIRAWKTSDKTQTIKAEATYDDLRINYKDEKFNKIITELHNYITKNPDLRLEIRIKIYEILGYHSDDQSSQNTKEEKIQNLFKKALTFKDQQLLSEVYSLYAEQGIVEDKLFYNTSAVEIQSRIGEKYFPKLYLRYLSLSSGYFSLNEYAKCISYGYKCINLLKKKNTDIYAFSLQYDLLGYSYYELNQPDSGIHYYQKIKEIVSDNWLKSADYKLVNRDEAVLRLIWNGVADGGIARGLIVKGEYDKASQLLFKNIESSEEYDQQLDLVKAKNLLASIYAQTGQNQKAIDYWHETIASASKFPRGNRYLIAATNGLAEMYKSMNRYDSAYHYAMLKQNFEKISHSEISQSKFQSVNARLQFEKLSNQIKTAEHTIEEQKSNRNLILAGSFGAFLILLFLYNRNRFKQTIKFKNLEIQQKISQIEKQRIEDELSTARSNIKIFIDKVNEKNELIENISNKLNELDSSEKKEVRETLEELRNTKIITDEDWSSFQAGFDKVYKGFSKNLLLKFPTITPAEQRYLMLTKIGLNHKEMARALGISSDSVRVTWNRVRNKMGGTLEDTPQTLIEKTNLKSEVV